MAKKVHSVIIDEINASGYFGLFQYLIFRMLANWAERSDTCKMDNHLNDLLHLWHFSIFKLRTSDTALRIIYFEIFIQTYFIWIYCYLREMYSSPKTTNLVQPRISTGNCSLLQQAPLARSHRIYMFIWDSIGARKTYRDPKFGNK